MTWNIFLGIVALVSFVIAVTTPIMKLNNTLTKLGCQFDNMAKEFITVKTDNKEIKEQVQDHEIRLVKGGL